MIHERLSGASQILPEITVGDAVILSARARNHYERVVEVSIQIDFIQAASFGKAQRSICIIQRV